MLKYRTAEEYLRDWPDGVSGGKGEGTSKSVMQQQLDLQKQAFDMQKSQLQDLKDNFGKYLTSNIGYDPAQLALLQSQFSDSTNQDYQTAGQNVRASINARGAPGATPASGQDIRGLIGLEGARAGTLAGGLRDIGLSNLQQAMTNRFNAGSLLTNNAATLSSPINSFGQGASSALNQYVQASNSGFGATFSRSLGGALGKTLGSGFGNNILGGLAGNG